MAVYLIPGPKFKTEPDHFVKGSIRLADPFVKNGSTLTDRFVMRQVPRRASTRVAVIMYCTYSPYFYFYFKKNLETYLETRVQCPAGQYWLMLELA
jgi:hypothetical protein